MLPSRHDTDSVLGTHTLATTQGEASKDQDKEGVPSVHPFPS